LLAALKSATKQRVLEVGAFNCAAWGRSFQMDEEKPGSLIEHRTGSIRGKISLTELRTQKLKNERKWHEPDKGFKLQKKKTRGKDGKKL